MVEMTSMMEDQHLMLMLNAKHSGSAAGCEPSRSVVTAIEQLKTESQKNFEEVLHAFERKQDQLREATRADVAAFQGAVRESLNNIAEVQI